MKRNLTPEQLFWSHVRIQPGCWLYEGATTSSGYGMSTYRGKATTAHRVAYQLAVGPIPDAHEVMHRCEERLCCRPDHLTTGTHMDNLWDREIKKLLRHPALTDAQRADLLADPRYHGLEAA